MGNGSPVSLLLLLLCSIVLTNSTLLITLNTQSLDQDSVLIIQFCKLCPSPEREGTIGETHHSPSILFLLLACFVRHSSRSDVQVRSEGISSHGRSVLTPLIISQSLILDLELVFCVPNHGQVKRMVNRRQLKDKIGFVLRGEVSLHEKALHAQAVSLHSILFSFFRLTDRCHQAGLLALVIADDGQCDDRFTSCGHRIGGVHDGGFSAFDSTDLWHQIMIPVVLVTQATGQKLQKLMEYEIVESEWGDQFFPILQHVDDEL
jgi:hypothetical protein